MASPQGREQQALDAVVARAAADPTFRRELLVNPREAIYRAFGVRIPDDFRVKFIERDAGVDALIVLPDLTSHEGELSDDELRAVSGGAPVAHSWSDDPPGLKR